MEGKNPDAHSLHFMGVDLEHWPVFMGTEREAIGAQGLLSQSVRACSRYTSDGSCQGVAIVPAELDGSLKV